MGFAARLARESFEQALEILRRLLATGADVQAEDSFGNNCAMRLILDARTLEHDYSNPELVEDLTVVFELLLSAGADLTKSTATRASPLDMSGSRSGGSSWQLEVTRPTDQRGELPATSFRLVGRRWPVSFGLLSPSTFPAPARAGCIAPRRKVRFGAGSVDAGGSGGCGREGAPESEFEPRSGVWLPAWLPLR